MDELERELLRMVTNELGEVRIMVCRSKLGSESGEIGKARFLGLCGTRGLEKREPGKREMIGKESRKERIEIRTGWRY